MFLHSFISIAQSDSIFLSWKLPSPFSKELPKAIYYHFSDTLTSPWQAGPFPNPNHGEFVIASNRWNEHIRLVVKNDTTVFFNEEVEVENFVYKPPLYMKPGRYTLIISKPGHSDLTHKLGVFKPDTIQMKKDSIKALGRKNIKSKFSVGIIPNPPSGKFAIVIQGSDCKEDEILNITLCSKEGKTLMQKKNQAFKSIVFWEEELGKGEYILKVQNSKMELSVVPLHVQ